jgi:hypothetical protein
MPKRQALVIFSEVNYELSLVMENVKRESWRRSTSSPKIGILVLIMHTGWFPNDQIQAFELVVMAVSNLQRQISTDLVI